MWKLLYNLHNIVYSLSCKLKNQKTMTDLKPATTYTNRFDLTRVNFDVNATYRVPLETGTGHHTTALARFTVESGWEYYHPSYDRWLLIPDDVEIFIY